MRLHVLERGVAYRGSSPQEENPNEFELLGRKFKKEPLINPPRLSGKLEKKQARSAGARR